MPFFQWSDKLETAVPEIDEQHRILVTYINKLHDAVMTNSDKEVLGPILSGLVNYTVYHFFTEESLMESDAYPDYEDHRKEHISLTEKTMDFFTRYHAGQCDIGDDLCDFLRDWLTTHIMITDFKLGAFLNGKAQR